MQTVHCSHHINIISAWLNKMLVCCHPTVINQLGLVDWRQVCFAWPQPIDKFIYLFFLWHCHRWKNISWISCYQTGFLRQHQTNNSLSFCDKLINNYSLLEQQYSGNGNLLWNCLQMTHHCFQPYMSLIFQIVN